MTCQKIVASSKAIAIAALCTMVIAASPARAQSDLARAYRIIASKQLVDLTHSFSPTTPVWSGFGQAKFSPAADPQTKEPYTIPKDGFRATYLRDGRAVRHARRSAGAFRRERDHHGPDPAQADDPAADRARQHALSGQGSEPRVLGRRFASAWEKKHGRVPKGSFVALRTDMSKDWDSNPERFKRSAVPGLGVRDHQVPLRATRRHRDRSRSRWTPTPPTRWTRRPTSCSTATIRSR